MKKYYLNHVGYKDFLMIFGPGAFARYYLNHVGYKVLKGYKKGDKYEIWVLSEPCGI